MDQNNKYTTNKPTYFQKKDDQTSQTKLPMQYGSKANTMQSILQGDESDNDS